MADIKATRKELFARIAEAMADDPDVVEMCNKYVEQLSKKRETKAQKAAAEFARTVYDYMVTLGEPVTNRDLAAHFEVTGQKITGALRRLRTEGKVDMISGEKTTDKPVYKVS